MSDAGGTLQPRLLVLASTYPRWLGDPEPGFVHELSRRLVNGFAVTVLCPHAPGAAVAEIMDGVQVVRYRYAPAFLECLVNDGGITTNLRRRPWAWLLVPGFVLAQAWMAWRLMQRLRPAVVHAHWLIPQGLIMALIKLLPTRVPPFLVTSHGADLFAFHSQPFHCLKRFVLRRAARATVVSEGMKREIMRLGAADSCVHVEPMGVDLKGRFNPAPAERRSRFELLFVGRLVEKKGLRHLLDAMPRIVEQCPEAILTIVGFGPEEAERRLQVQSLGLDEHVRFVGPLPQSELPRLYRRATVFVAPFVPAASGDQEGLGLVLIEALGCGCPVIVSNLPATEGAVANLPGVRMVPAADSCALADAVVERLQNPSVVDPDDALLEFDWENRAARYAGILHAIAGSES